jgi:fluoride exporter
MTVLLVIIGGGLGAITRFLLDGTIGTWLADRREDTDYPLGTLIVNLSGALLLGLLVGFGSSHRVMTLLGTATLGSYTTFSTWMLETHRPAQDGDARLAWVNIALSVSLGLAAVVLGRAIGRLL